MLRRRHNRQKNAAPAPAAEDNARRGA